MSSKLILPVALTVSLGMVAPLWAAEEAPAKPVITEWKKMRPSSFAPTIKSAREQCDRTAKVDEGDALTPEKCELFERKLKEGSCERDLVVDGIVFDFMNGRTNGHSAVSRNLKKALGRPDPALVCDLGDRVYAYWFRDDPGRSCNNVGIVFRPEPPPPPPVAAPAPAPTSAPVPAPAPKPEPPPPPQSATTVGSPTVTVESGVMYVTPGIHINNGCLQLHLDGTTYVRQGEVRRGYQVTLPQGR